MEATFPEGIPHIVACTPPWGLHFFIVLTCCIDSLNFYRTLVLYAEMWYVSERMVLPSLTLTDHRKCMVAYAFWKYVLFEFWNLSLILVLDWRLEVQGHKETIHNWIGPHLPHQIIFQSRIKKRCGSLFNLPQSYNQGKIKNLGHNYSFISFVSRQRQD